MAHLLLVRRSPAEPRGVSQAEYRKHAGVRRRAPREMKLSVPVARLIESLPPISSGMMMPAARAPRSRQGIPPQLEALSATDWDVIAAILTGEIAIKHEGLQRIALWLYQTAPLSGSVATPARVFRLMKGLMRRAIESMESPWDGQVRVALQLTTSKWANAYTPNSSWLQAKGSGESAEEPGEEPAITAATAPTWKDMNPADMRALWHEVAKQPLPRAGWTAPMPLRVIISQWPRDILDLDAVWPVLLPALFGDRPRSEQSLAVLPNPWADLLKNRQKADLLRNTLQGRTDWTEADIVWVSRQTSKIVLQHFSVQDACIGEGLRIEMEKILAEGAPADGEAKLEWARTQILLWDCLGPHVQDVVRREREALTRPTLTRPDPPRSAAPLQAAPRPAWANSVPAALRRLVELRQVIWQATPHEPLGYTTVLSTLLTLGPALRDPLPVEMHKPLLLDPESPLRLAGLEAIRQDRALCNNEGPRSFRSARSRPVYR